MLFRILYLIQWNLFKIIDHYSHKYLFFPRFTFQYKKYIFSFFSNPDLTRSNQIIKKQGFLQLVCLELSPMGNCTFCNLPLWKSYILVVATLEFAHFVRSHFEYCKLYIFFFVDWKLFFFVILPMVKFYWEVFSPHCVPSEF